MNVVFNKNLVFVAPLLVVGVALSIALSPLVIQYPVLAMGVNYDLTITSPLIYFLCIRKKRVSNFTVVPVFIIGILLTKIILPQEHHTHVDFINFYVLPIIELLVFSIVLRNVYRLKKEYKIHQLYTHDFYQSFKMSAQKLMGNQRVAGILTTEVSMIYYALICWKKRSSNAYQFTSYKANGSLALYGVILFLMFIETFVVHVILHTYGHYVTSWILLMVSIYSFIQFFGHVKAMVYRKSMMDEENIFLKYGLFGDVTIPLSSIKRVEVSSQKIEGNEMCTVHKLSLLGELEPHNIILYLENDVTIHKAYGMTKSAHVLLVSIDSPQEFMTVIHQKGVCLDQ